MGQLLKKYLEEAKQIGFESITELPFEYKNQMECLYIFFEPRRAILLCFDSYNNNTILNGGQFYYNFEYKSVDRQPDVRSSGRWSKTDKWIWVGSHDCRNLKFDIKRLDKYVKFKNPWVEAQKLWLFNYADFKDDENQTSFDKLRECQILRMERMKLLPDSVKKALAIEK